MIKFTDDFMLLNNQKNRNKKELLIDKFSKQPCTYSLSVLTSAFFVIF